MKVKLPTQAEARSFYDQNRARVKEEFDAVKDEIVAYLTGERQRTEAKKIFGSATRGQQYGFELSD